MELVQIEAVNKAFSRQAVHFDELEKNNQVLQWMRARVRNRVMTFLPAGGHILELNAGTGMDAVYFAQKGFSVHATEFSDGMFSVLKQKIDVLQLGDKIQATQLSYTHLESLPSKSYDCIFSNFGGLNCVPDLEPVIRQFGRLLKPGGMAVLVVMPPLSFWELGSFFKGHFRMAFRRLGRNGSMAQLEGASFRTWYFGPGRLIKNFGKDFRLLKLEGLGSLVPPPHMEDFPARYPSLFKKLCSMEEKMGENRPFNSCADHFILSMQYFPLSN